MCVPNKIILFGLDITVFYSKKIKHYLTTNNISTKNVFKCNQIFPRYKIIHIPHWIGKQLKIRWICREIPQFLTVLLLNKQTITQRTAANSSFFLLNCLPPFLIQLHHFGRVFYYQWQSHQKSRKTGIWQS